MIRYILSFLSCMILYSCATYQAKYSNQVVDWKASYEASKPTTPPVYTLYAIGDSGYKPDGKTAPAISGLKQQIANASKNSGVIFLGDNIYRHGMPEKSHPERAKAEEAIDQQIDAVADFDGDIFFIPGNHDWYAVDGVKRVKREEDYVEKKLKSKVFYPDNACSGPEIFKLSKDLVMIIVDSEWYLHKWDKSIDFNENCPYKTRYDFIYELQDQIKKYAKDKRVVVAIHHPIFTYGEHGGRFSFQDHIFPLANLHKPIWVPLPGLGTLYTMLRKSSGIMQDIYEEKYKEFRHELLRITDPFDDVIFISGHEHNMQYIYREDHHHVIAGSGSKTTPVALGDGSDFSKGAYGFARLSFYDRGETWIEYMSYDENGNSELAYAKKLTDRLTDFDPVKQTYEIPKTPFVKVPVIKKDMKKSGLFTMLMGKQYSDLYNKPIKARVTNLSIKNGGLKPVKRGGGFATNSLRLEDSKGRDWVLRSIEKDPTKLLADEFVGTSVIDAVEHFMTSAHPLAAFTIPEMADAIGILHTMPELLYIPKQKALGVFNEDYGNQLYLFEDRPDGDRTDRANFGRSIKMINTDDLLQKMKETSFHRPDQQDVVRNRLFDIILGDWDRHDDQWRWAKFERGKDRIYRPVPRDRDQPYSVFQGSLMSLARIASPAIAKFQTFDHKLRNWEYFNFNARYFDRTFLNELEWEDWKVQVDHIQNTLSDEAIHAGMSNMQEDFYELNGADLESKLKTRRNDIEIYARKYYLSLAREVDITGTNQDDRFEIKQLPNGALNVRVSEVVKKGKKEHLFYQRTFYKEETKEIRLYGLDGNDHFIVSGDVPGSIKIRLIGNTDKDTYTNNASKRSKVHAYDYPEKTEIEGSGNIHEHLSHDYRTNNYNRKAFKYNHSFVIPMAGFNPDNGFMLGGLFTATRHGFKKDPFKSAHTFSGLYSFKTEGYKLNYAGNWVDVLGKWNLGFDALFQDKFFTNNFFGFGNESINPTEESDVDEIFNKQRQSILGLKLKLINDFSEMANFHLAPIYEMRKVNYTEGRFLESMSGPDDIQFQRQNFIGGEFAFHFRNVDVEYHPRRGASFDVKTDYLTNLDDNEITKTSLMTSLALYFPIGSREKLVSAHKIGTGINFSDDHLFYHAQQLGGTSNLRGFRNERFTGNSSLYYNTDLRLELASIQGHTMSSEIGIYAGFDIGRVWWEDEDKDRWHTDYGGGIWIAPFKMAIVRAGYFLTEDEGGRLTVGVGFEF